MVVERRWGGDLTAQTLMVYRDAECINLANIDFAFFQGPKHTQKMSSVVAFLKSVPVLKKLIRTPK